MTETERKLEDFVSPSVIGGSQVLVILTLISLEGLFSFHVWSAGCTEAASCSKTISALGPLMLHLAFRVYFSYNVL